MIWGLRGTCCQIYLFRNNGRWRSFTNLPLVGHSGGSLFTYKSDASFFTYKTDRPFNKTVGQKIMSWDIFVQDIPKDAVSVADIPDDFEPCSIGARQEIIGKIPSIIPTANFEDPAWGIIDGPDYSIEVKLGKDEILDGFSFHIRGGSLSPFVVANILATLNLRAFDPNSESGMFSICSDDSEGQKRWREYRDLIVNTKK